MFAAVVITALVAEGALRCHTRARALKFLRMRGTATGPGAPGGGPCVNIIPYGLKP